MSFRQYSCAVQPLEKFRRHPTNFYLANLAFVLPNLDIVVFFKNLIKQNCLRSEPNSRGICSHATAAPNRKKSKKFQRPSARLLPAFFGQRLQPQLWSESTDRSEILAPSRRWQGQTLIFYATCPNSDSEYRF